MSDVTLCCNVQIDIDFLHIHEDKVRSPSVLRRWLPRVSAQHLPTPPKHHFVSQLKRRLCFFFQVWDRTVYDSGALPLESKCIHF